MTYGELQAMLARYLHRSDLGTVIPDFVELARTRINQRFNAELLPFSSDVDTNEVLDTAPQLYLYGALAEAHAYLDNKNSQELFDGMFSATADRQNVTQPGLESLDPWAGDDAPELRITKGTDDAN